MEEIRSFDSGLHALAASNILNVYTERPQPVKKRKRDDYDHLHDSPRVIEAKVSAGSHPRY